MTDTSVVRIATRQDEPEIMRLLYLMHAESAILALDEDAAREMFDRAFDRKGGIIGVVGAANNIEGMIYLLISRWWYTRDNHLEELFNFVRPDCRKSNHARDLIKFAKQCADEIKIPLVIGVLTHTRVVEKVRLYRRSLGLPNGAFWVYGGNWGNVDLTDCGEVWAMPEHRKNKKRLVA